MIGCVVAVGGGCFESSDSESSELELELELDDELDDEDELELDELEAELAVFFELKNLKSQKCHFLIKNFKIRYFE